MPFGVGCDDKVEMLAGLGANEVHEFVGVAEFPGFSRARRQIATQCDDAADAGCLVLLQYFANVLTR